MDANVRNDDCPWPESKGKRPKGEKGMWPGFLSLKGDHPEHWNRAEESQRSRPGSVATEDKLVWGGCLLGGGGPPGRVKTSRVGVVKALGKEGG